MTPTDFANAVAREKNSQVAVHFAEGSKTEVASVIGSMGLSPAQREQLRTALDAALRDFAYTLLLGVDGAAQIGGSQTAFHLTDEDGHELAGGKLESAAWRALQQESSHN